MTRTLTDPLIFRRLWLTAMLLVVAGSTLPSVPDPASLPGDKWQHFLSYTVLATLAMLSFAQRGRALVAALAMVGLGACIELVQYLLPWREFEWLDMLANTAGVACGIILGSAASTLVSRRRPGPVSR